MKTLKDIIGIVVCIISYIIAGYLGLWMMFMKPIIQLCKSIDAGTVTAIAVGTTVIKCLLASSVAAVIILIGTFIAKILWKD